MAELKPCPFCGGEAEVVKVHSGVAMFPYTVVCKSDECSASVGVFKETRGKAIEAWNTRKPMEAVVAELEKQKDKAMREYEKTCCTGGYEHDYADGASDAYEKAISIVRGKE